MEHIDKIIVKIRELEKEYQDSQGMILTEEDLQCHVFRIIHPLFHDDLDTMDSGIRGSQLHSELKFFDEQDKLSIVPDITVLDTARLSIHTLLMRKYPPMESNMKSIERRSLSSEVMLA
jgi:hypothetical protein